MSGRPTQFASKTGVGTTGRFLCSNDAEQRRPPGSKRCETKVRMVWGVFLLLQQRSKHPREMVTTPKASTLKLAWHVKKKTGRTHTHDKNNTTHEHTSPPPPLNNDGLSNVLSPASRGRAPARLRKPEPRMRLAVRGVPKGARRTHSA